MTTVRDKFPTATGQKKMNYSRLFPADRQIFPN